MDAINEAWKNFEEDQYEEWPEGATAEIYDNGDTVVNKPDRTILYNGE